MTKKEIESLFKTHYARMYRLALSILCDRDESRDVVSEVFAHLLSRETVLISDTAERYLMQSVRNACLNVLERRLTREQYERMVAAEGRETIGSDEERMQMEELVSYVEHNLPPLTLRIFKERYLHEKTTQEVADSVGVSRMTVHTHLKQSMERIRTFFKSNI